jgi:ABC-type transport system involved in cytochrome c biogenesis permease subunit
MYESVVFVAFGAAIFGLIYGLISRKGFILAAGAVVATIVLLIAENCPLILDPAIRPLTPVLRSNFWLAIHVMTIMLSYAAFALAFLMGLVALGYYAAVALGRTQDGDLMIESLNTVIRQLLQAGLLLLILGTFLGAAWADYAWGRFWGWDPKEVWALITLLVYSALLHARRVGWTRDFGLAAFAVLCFVVLFMAWYGVNYWLGVGLHSYGFGGGGQGYVVAALALVFAYVGVVTIIVAASETRPAAAGKIAS